MLEVSEVVILAGGSADKLGQSAPCKGLVSVNGKTLLELTVEGFLKDPRFKKVVITAPVDPVDAIKNVSMTGSVLSDPRVETVVTDSSVIDNLIQGINRTSGQFIMVSTADVPFIGPEAIEGMIEACSAEPADFYYPIIPEETVHTKFPDFSKTYMKTGSGTFAGGNLFLIQRDTASNNKDFLDDLYLMRKSPRKLVGKLGWAFVLKFLAKSITIGEMEEKVSELMRCRGKAVIINFPEIGIDIDSAEDLKTLERHSL